MPAEVTNICGDAELLFQTYKAKPLAAVKVIGPLHKDKPDDVIWVFNTFIRMVSEWTCPMLSIICPATKVVCVGE